MGGIEYVYRDGSRLTPWMLYVINRASDELYQRFGVRLLVTSGIRTHQEQINIFLKRYRVQWVGNGPYGDVRWWKGKRYVSVSGAGAVAAPGTSNHEVQGTKAAVDLRDSGRDAGVNRPGNARANWLRANARRLGLIASGYGFSEAWHYDVPDIFRTPPGKPAGKPAGKPSKPLPTPVIVPEEEEDDMLPVIIKTGNEWSLLDPDVGTDLTRMIPGQDNKCRTEKTGKGVVNTYRGLMVTTDPDVGDAWSRSYCRRYGNAPQTRDKADYQAAQAEASRLSVEKHRP